MKMDFLQVLIIGMGPAGIAAAIQLKRYGFTPIVLEKESLGGLLRNANLVENYPGFPNGVSGPNLVALFERQIKQIDIDITFDEVLRLEYENGWLVESKQALYHPDVVVVATGTKPKPFPVDIPADASGNVFNEVWHFAGVSGKKFVIVGAGDAAFDYALNLAARGNSVTILNREREISSLPLLWDRAKLNPSISYLAQTNLRRIEFDFSANGLILTTDRCVLDADYCLFAIGRVPALDFLSESVKRQERTLVESGKLYFAGDVHSGQFRQAAIAVGAGLMVAMRIFERVSLRGA